jgi:hypothetical protein
MTSRTMIVRVKIFALNLLSAVVATAGCDGGPARGHGDCEDGVPVYRRADGTELSRSDCAADEQCVERSPDQPVCRLFESCQAASAWQNECRGDALIVCNPEEQFRERIDCVTKNHGKPVPGRCAQDARFGADCVDRDAVPCDFSFKESCNGDERQVCLNGYTSRQAACSEPDRQQGGTCRLDAMQRAVCAQPEAQGCFPDDRWGVCEYGAIVTCLSGFVFRRRCPEGETCRVGMEGDVQLAVCEVL